MIKTGNASNKHGLILKYWLVVVPIGYDSVQKPQSNDQLMSDDLLPSHETREKDVANLLKYSTYNQSVLSNESSYIAAEFLSEFWPITFLLGDGKNHGLFLNRKLMHGFDYKTYIIAFTDDSTNSNSRLLKPNMVGLGDIQNFKPRSSSSHYLEGDLFSYSIYSEVFNTRHIEAKPKPIHSFAGLGIGISDYHNILWVIGAIAAFIFIFILIIVVSVNLMQKKTKLASNSPARQNGSSTGTSSTTTNFVKPVDTQVIMNKMGSYTTNTLKKNSHDLTNGQAITARSSSSSSSSTTVSPTTALLSCSVNNTSCNNVGAGSQSSNNTNNTNILLNSNGLLTAASPIRTVTLPNPSEGLYTSIEVTQRLLQDTQNQMMNMMMNTFNTGTLRMKETLGTI